MEQNIQSSGNMFTKKFGIILSCFIFLLPLFFVPADSVGLYAAKVTLLATGLVAMIAFFLSSVLSTGIIEMPKVRYLIPIGAFAAIALVSSTLSGSIKSSIIGSVFDFGTSGSIVMIVFSLFLTIIATKNISEANRTISAFIYSAAVLAVYTLLGSFGSSLLPSSIASKLPLFPVGGLIDTAIIFGAVVILSLCALNSNEISKKMKYVFWVLIAFSMLFIGTANFTPAIVVLGIVSLVFFVYVLSWSVGSGSVSRKFSLSSLVVLVASVILLLGGSGIGGFLSKTMKIQATEIRPNFETTMNLAKDSWKENFVFGIGPNRFAEFWSAHKPMEINQTQFWNSDFYSGSGFVPTVAITTGLLGLLAVLAFIGMYAQSGIKAIFSQTDNDSRYLATSSFLVSFYLWIMLFVYTPSIAVVALTFVFTGIFTSTLVPQGIAGLWRINIFSNPKTNFLSVLSIVILLIMSIAGGYFVWERTVASVVFEKGVLEYQKGNIAAAEESMVKSINMAQTDIYWRGLVEVSLADLSRIFGSVTNQSQITDSIKAEAQESIANAVGSAKKAVEINDSFQNWFVLGRVYEVLAGSGMEGALENARNAYNEAATRSSNNPSVPLALARLNALAGDTNGARTNIAKALELKNNYTDAYYTLAQLEAAANNITGAIQSVEAATLVDPTNSGLYFQLGLLKYNQRNFAGAASAFERAVALVPDYANAKYFLGLSYYQLDRNEEAIKQFEEIGATNPSNEEVQSILTNLKSGRAPFSSAKSESKNKPPIEE